MPKGKDTDIRVMVRETEVGIYLDTHLTFDQHVKERCSKAGGMINLMRAFKGTRRGPRIKGAILW